MTDTPSFCVQGTLNLIAAAVHTGTPHFVLLSAIGVEDAMPNPLNLFWGTHFWKKRAEEALVRSGLTYTIVRPGPNADDIPANAKGPLFGLLPKSERGVGSVVMRPAGTFGMTRTVERPILRSKVRIPRLFIQCLPVLAHACNWEPVSR